MVPSAIVSVHWHSLNWPGNVRTQKPLLEPMFSFAAFNRG
jgi:hypothetical protein